MSSVAVAAVMGQALAQVGLEETRATWESDATPPIRAWQHGISALEKFPLRSWSVVKYMLKNNHLCNAETIFSAFSAPEGDPNPGPFLA